MNMTVKKMVGFEDDILIGYVIEYLSSGGGTEEANVTRSTATKGELRKVFVSGPDMFTYLLPFFDSHTETFMTELWELLRAAEASPIGIPDSANSTPVPRPHRLPPHLIPATPDYSDDEVEEEELEADDYLALPSLSS